MVLVESPIIGAAVDDESPIIVVESLPIMGVVSVVVVSVVVSAVFGSHEARPAANTTARADTFSRFFIFGVGLKVSSENALNPEPKEK